MVVNVLAALAEPTRLEAMRILWDGDEVCACELIPRLSATQSRVSRHMQVLKQAGLVIDRRDAQRVLYRINPGLGTQVRNILNAVLDEDAETDRSAA